MEWLTGWSIWLILGFILFILETVITGVFIMWWGGAAIIIAIVVALFPDIALSVQFTLFALLAIFFSLAWWKFQQTRDAQEDHANILNDREHAMLGQLIVISLTQSHSKSVYPKSDISSQAVAQTNSLLILQSYNEFLLLHR